MYFEKINLSEGCLEVQFYPQSISASISECEKILIEEDEANEAKTPIKWHI